MQDVHFLALDLNEPELAESARQKAEDLHAGQYFSFCPLSLKLQTLYDLYIRRNSVLIREGP